MSDKGNEREVSLSFKYAHRPSSLKQEEALISPRGSEANLQAAYPRPSVCSPSSLPLKQDAIYQSFPVPSPRASLRRSSPKRSYVSPKTRKTPPYQILSFNSPGQSPRSSPYPTPHKITTGSEERFDWSSSNTTTSALLHLVGDDSGADSGAKAPRGKSSLPVDGGESLTASEDRNPYSESLTGYHAQDQPRKPQGRSGSKESEVLGHVAESPQVSPTSTRTKRSTKRTNGKPSPEENGDKSGTSDSLSSSRRKTTGLMGFIKSPSRSQTAKDFIHSCIPRNSRKSSKTSAYSDTEDALPNSRINHKYSPPPNTTIPAELSKTSTRSESRRHGFFELPKTGISRRSKKGRSNEASPTLLEASTLPSIEDGDDQSPCFVGGEAQRFRTPLESPRIPGSPNMNSQAVSPRSVDRVSQGRHSVPSYFNLRRRGTDVSPGTTDLPSPRFTPRHLSDPAKEHGNERESPHFVRIPYSSQADDYRGRSEGPTLNRSSRRSSFPPIHRLSTQSSASGVLESGRRASFGPREMSFLTKSDGHSTSIESAGKRHYSSSGSESAARQQYASSLGSVSIGRSHGYSHSFNESGSSESRKASLGERRASRVITSIDMTRKRSSTKTIEEGNGHSSHASHESSNLVHWRGAEVTEEEAKMLDMLVGRHRLFSEILTDTNEKPDGTEKAFAGGDNDKPETILRRPSWKRFASTIGNSPLSGLQEESSILNDTKVLDMADDVPNVSELYAGVLQQILGLPAKESNIGQRDDQDAKAGSKLSRETVQKQEPNEFITVPDSIKTEEPSSMAQGSRRSTVTKYETEILSIAMLYGKVFQESSRPASEPDRSPTNEGGPAESSRAPSSTIPQRPSVGFFTNALQDRSQSDTLVSDVRRVSLNPQSKSRRSSSTIARLAKLGLPRHSSSVSPLETPGEGVNKSRHLSLSIPSLIAALRSIRAANRDKEVNDSKIGLV